MKKTCIFIAICLFFFNASQAVALSIQDGQIHTISMAVQQLNVDYQAPNAGTTVKLISDGYINTGNFYGKSQYLQSGGYIGYAWFYDQSTSFVSGGSMHRYALCDEAQLFISGSDGCSSIDLVDSSKFTLYGNDLIISAYGVTKTYGPGIYTLSDFNLTTSGFVLESHLLNGQIFSTHFNLSSETSQIIVIPEPATLTLLTLGGLLIRRRK